jgi:hypothetical protein
MKALVKTLFGDIRNVTAVAAVVAIAAVLTVTGHAAWAVVVMPVACLAAVGWLARS